MHSERLRLTAGPAALAAELRALVPAAESVSDQVAEILDEVRRRGDSAVRDFSARFEPAGSAGPGEVSRAQLDQALAQLETPVREGLERAIENVRRVGEATLSPERTVSFPGHEVRWRHEPVERAAVYVPAGRAPYPSTVVMGVVSACVAGVGEVVVSAPPAGASVHPLILAACRLTGADAVFAMGGAQAIAALAYGTASVPAVDSIVGPGNLYVQEAKRQVSALVGIDGFAGPSDLVALADGDVDPHVLALDLLAQAEHGHGSLVVGISRSGALLAAVAEDLAAAPETGAVVRLVEVDDLEREGLPLVQALAPEHLQLMGETAEALAGRVTRAGCVFVGAASATAFGDYIAGSNHVLPTAGAARFASGLSPEHFRRRFTEVRVGEGVPELARLAAPVARAEGFELHARSMEVRMGENSGG